MDERLVALARVTKGFMPEDEGLALYDAALEGTRRGPAVEIGSYCGRSTIYLGAAAAERDTVVYSIDHHRGSEEHQPGEPYHDPDLTDPRTGAVDTFAEFRKTITRARLSEHVVALVARSEVAAKGWQTPLGFLFIDGGHGEEDAFTDLRCWTPHLVAEGLLAIHDVFEDPQEGGRPPFLIYTAALDSGRFEEISSCGSLRVLRRTGMPERDRGG